MVSPALKSIRTLSTFEGCVRSMSIGPGTSAAASGVMIGSPDADADADGERGVPAAAGPSPSVLNAIAVPAAAVRTLVKLLVLADGHRMHRESLVALLWPDRDTASGMNNLHQALHVARRVLAPGSGGRRGAVVDTMA